MYRLNSFHHVVVVGMILSISAACGEDDTNNATNNTTNNPPGEQIDECEPYEPTEASGSESLMWTEQEGETSFTFTAPDDPGGGWVRIEVNTPNEEISPGVVARLTDGRQDTGAIISGSAAGRDDEQTTIRFFETAPSRSYTVTLGQFGNDSPDAYPVTVTADWEFTSVVDCYEPNDSAEEAKRIPIGEEIEAYSLAGYRDEDNGFSNRSLDDWYEITLDEEAVINVEMTQTPGANRMSIPIYGAAGEEDQVGSGGNTDGEAFTSTTDDPVPPGTYFVVVRTADAEPRKTEFDEPLPDAWTTPYRIVVTAD